MRVETVQAHGSASWVVGVVGTNSERFRKVTITAWDLETLTILDPCHTFDGDGRLLRLGLQAYALGIAYEFDPHFGLSISRLPSARGGLRLPSEARPGAIPARGRCRRRQDHYVRPPDSGTGSPRLAERILIVCPANLACQWQRELKEKIDANFLVLKGQDIREQFGVNQWMERDRVITSLDLAKCSEILPGLRQVHWDLVMVDEAHQMSAADESHKSPRYRLGELLRTVQITFWF
jgi:hypothetical protein